MKRYQLYVCVFWSGSILLVVSWFTGQDWPLVLPSHPCCSPPDEYVFGTHPCLCYLFGSFPECPERLTAMRDKLLQSGLLERCIPVAVRRGLGRGDVYLWWEVITTMLLIDPQWALAGDAFPGYSGPYFSPFRPEKFLMKRSFWLIGESWSWSGGGTSWELNGRGINSG